MKLIYLSLSAFLAFGLIACGGDDKKNPVNDNVCFQLTQDNVGNFGSVNSNQYRDLDNNIYIAQGNNTFLDINSNRTVTCTNQVNTNANNNFCASQLNNNGFNNFNNGFNNNYYNGQTQGINPLATSPNTTNSINGQFYPNGSLNNCNTFTYNCQPGVDPLCINDDGSTLNTWINGRYYNVYTYPAPVYYYNGAQYGGGLRAFFQLSVGF